MKNVLGLTLLFVLIGTIGASGQQIELAADANPQGTAFPQLFTVFHVFNDKLYFVASDGTHGTELWVTDGTPQGSHLVKDINPGGDSDPLDFVTLGSKMYFRAQDQTGYSLWESDGTTGGTQKVGRFTIDQEYYYSPMHPAQSLNVLGDRFYFGGKADTSSAGIELWASDGTASGTVLVKDIDSVFFHSGSPQYFYPFNGKLYFRALTGAYGWELWATDGTTQGTTLVADINPNGSSSPFLFTEFNGKLYFQADDGTHGVELWSTDGIGNTQLVRDLNPSGDGNPNDFTIFNGQLYFSAQDATNDSVLWVTDGTTSGTHTVTTAVGSTVRLPQYLTAVGNKLFFSAYDALHGYELWVMDGTPATPHLLIDIDTGGSSYPFNLTEFNGQLYFSAEDGTPVQRYDDLWTTDGTVAGTHKLRPNIQIGGASVHPNIPFVIYDSSLYYVAGYGVAGGDYKLWRVRGGLSGVSERSDSSGFSLGSTVVAGSIELRMSSPAEISIMNILGQVVLEQFLTRSGELDIRGLPDGIYFIRTATTVTRFVKVSP